MKKSLLLIPSLVALSATPIMSLTGCVVDVGGGDKPEPTPPEPVEDWVTWDFIKDGMFTKDIEKAPSSTPSTPEACNAAYFEWLSKNKNNIIYDYLLSISDNWDNHWTEYKVSIKINNIDTEKHLISFNFKLKTTYEYEVTNYKVKDEFWYDIECINIEYSPLVLTNTQTGVKSWKMGSIITDSKLPDPIHQSMERAKKLAINTQRWCAKGSYWYKSNGVIEDEQLNVSYDINDAVECVQKTLDYLESCISNFYDAFNFISVFLSDVPLPS